MEKFYSACFAAALALTGIGFAENPQTYYRRQAAEMVKPLISSGDVALDSFPAEGEDLAKANVPPLDQYQDSQDLKITRQLRQSIGQDTSLSVVADQIKISTNNGTVTLQGVVRSPQEKETIDAKARRIEGVNRIDNQLIIQGS